MVRDLNKHASFTDFVLNRMVSVLNREYQVWACAFRKCVCLQRCTHTNTQFVLAYSVGVRLV